MIPIDGDDQVPVAAAVEAFAISTRPFPCLIFSIKM